MIEGFREVSVKIPNTVGNDPTEFKTTINAGGHNQFTNQRTNKYEYEITTFGFNDVQLVNWYNGQTFARGLGNYAAGTWSGEHIHHREAFTKFIAQYNNGPREKISATFINTAYSFLKKMDFNSKEYLPQRLTLTAEMDEWQGEWLEFNYDNTGVGKQTSDK